MAEPQGQYRSANDIPVATKQHVNMIFARFMAIYGHKFKSSFETENEIRLAKREWALSLKGYGEHELVMAVNRCKETMVWMPTISDFLTILRDINGDFGLPSPYQAYQEAALHADHPTQHTWSHIAIYHAGRATGWFELRTEDEADIFDRFSYNYAQVCRRVREGEELDAAVPHAIENRSESTTARFMLAFAKQHGVSEEDACSWLYYLTCPKGSASRKRLQRQAQAKVQQLGLDIVLPDDVGSITAD